MQIINYTIIWQRCGPATNFKVIFALLKDGLRCVDHPFSAEPGATHHAAPCISMTVVPGSFFITTLQRNLNLNIPRKRIGRPQSQFPHSCVRERSIYFHVRPTYFPAAKQADRSEEYINHSQKYEFGNQDCSRAVPFLEIFVSNFRYCVFAVQKHYV